MAEFDLESVIKKGVEEAINKPVYGGKSITEWAAIGMKAPRWISVKERLPEKNGRYLVCDKNGEVYSAEYEKNRPDSEWTDDYEGYLDMEVTHWMPLPERPEEVTTDDP